MGQKLKSQSINQNYDTFGEKKKIKIKIKKSLISKIECGDPKTDNSDEIFEKFALFLLIE